MKSAKPIPLSLREADLGLRAIGVRPGWLAADCGSPPAGNRSSNSALRAERPAADNAGRAGCRELRLWSPFPHVPRSVGFAAFLGAVDRTVADCPAPAVFASIDRV